MIELSLFSGAGGGLLGSKLLGWKCVGYVEQNEYCQRVLRARIRDGFLDDAPIFPDVRTFNGRPYRGRVDIVTAGFPCQPFSVAGRRKGAGDERNMWPDTIRIIREVRPRCALLENVPGLISSGYFGTVLGDLAESGFDAEWCVLSAQDCGAPHIRKRLWIVASNTNGNKLRKQSWRSQRESGPERLSLEAMARRNAWPTPQARDWKGGNTPKPHGQHSPGLDVVVGGPLNPTWVEWLMGWPLNWSSLEPLPKENWDEWTEKHGSKTGSAIGQPNPVRAVWWDKDPSETPCRSESAKQCADKYSGALSDMPQRGAQEGRNLGARHRSSSYVPNMRETVSTQAPTSEGSATVQQSKLFEGKRPAISRAAVGVVNRVERLRALGNGQVPIVAAAAWGELTS